MKLVITGSELESHLRPLRAVVRNSEGINYDQTAMAVYEEEGRMLLTAMTQQPTYDVYMELNLSGNPDNSEAPGMQPLDADAQADKYSECWMLSNSALSAFNRSIGQSPATYEMGSNRLKISLGETNDLYLDASHTDDALTVPVYMTSVQDNDMTAYGEFDAGQLYTALLTPINVCALSMKAGHMKERAIHFNMGYEAMTIEALSSTVQVASECNSALRMDKSFKGMGQLHFSISLPAARIIHEILLREGGEVHWVYSEMKGVLTLWFDTYVMTVDTIDLGEYQCEMIHPSSCGFSVGRKQLWDVLRRAKAAGCDLIVMKCENCAGVTIESENGNVETALDITLIGQGLGDMTYRLPVSTLQALLRGTTQKDVEITQRKDKNIVLDIDGDTVAIVRNV